MARVSRLGSILSIAVATVAVSPAFLSAQTPSSPQVTFSKDVMPIFQEKCQECHRPGSIAPMSLISYRDARPWARSIKERVVSREMPPWYIEKNIGIQHFKWDRGLSDKEIETIAKWVDGGALEGNRADLPPARQFTDSDHWTIGTPDLVVALPDEMTIKAVGPDWWLNIETESGLTEDRYVQAVETKPSKSGQRVTHHAVAHADAPDGTDFSLNEYAVGKNGDIFAPDTGLLLKAHSKITFNMHYHSIGEETKDRTSVAIKFHPKGFVPKYELKRTKAGSTYMELDIPAGQVSRTDGYTVLDKPTVLLSFQPHMHNRGSRMCMEAIYPDQRIETLSCAKHNFEWMVNYIYADNHAPLLPAGTILHTIGWHDNTTANRYNPNPRNWAGFGNRSIDDMSFAWVTLYNVEQAEFDKLVEERHKAALRRSTN